MLPRLHRTASVILLIVLLADTLLGSCVPRDGLRRSQEDAWLLSIAGYYQLTGELPAMAMAGRPRMARLAGIPAHFQEPTTPNEAWALIEYYGGLREKFEQKAKADGLPPEVIRAGLAEYDAKITALVEKAKDLDARRARRRGTVWKRFFDGLGRAIGRAFEIGGRIVKYAVEGLPADLVEYGPELVRQYARAYVEKLKGDLRTKGEQKAFEILAEKNPNLAGAYLIFKAGREGVKMLRDFARLFGRQRRGGQIAQAPTGASSGQSDAEDSGRAVVQIGPGDVQGSLTGSIAQFAPPTMFDICANARVGAPITGLMLTLNFDLETDTLTGTLSGSGVMAQGSGEHPPDSASVSVTGSITEGTIEPQGDGWVFIGTGTATLTYQGTYTCATIDWQDKPDDYQTTSGGSSSTVEIKVAGDTLGHALSLWTEKTLSGPEANVGFVTNAGWALDNEFAVVKGSP